MNANANSQEIPLAHVQSMYGPKGIIQPLQLQHLVIQYENAGHPPLPLDWTQRNALVTALRALVLFHSLALVIHDSEVYYQWFQGFPSLESLSNDEKHCLGQFWAFLGAQEIPGQAILVKDLNPANPELGWHARLRLVDNHLRSSWAQSI